MPPPFDFQPLNRAVFGPGTITRLGELTREHGGRRIMLVTDPGLAKAGHPQRAEQLLREAGLEVFLFDAVKENPTTKDVAVGVEFARKHQVDFLVAIGGGSSMDCAKGVNFIYTNGGRMADYKGHGKATKPMLPSIGVPTTSGTGSEAQSFALITDESSHMKMACGDKKAAFRVAILDPELTLSQPRGVTAVTGIDAIAHAVESYVCTRRNPISQLYSLAAWQYLEPNLETVLREPHNLTARGAMQVGAHFAGVAIENAMLGIAHSCANPLTAHYGVIHGTAIGMLLPHVVRFNAMAVDHLYQELPPVGVTLNGEPVSEMVARRIQELVQLAGLPTRLRDVGVSDTILPLLALEANEQWTARFNPRTVGEPELQGVYEKAW
ncbi:iron-containing alcohol dehydrogenase [Zavarzinella formosa]|uniref:iron-containing alcohol dehydrogenase n=1 Tax=Zavarzinella formosa TaxID=360055 RepID=UPI0002FB99AA|nr:iron-containing alcohol dehydrogenase [Zavarzinella formosa]